MPNLRTHVREDSVLGNVTQANLELVIDALDWVAHMSAHPILRFLCPLRRQARVLPLLAATFSRIRGVPEPLGDAGPILAPVSYQVPADRASLPSHEDFLASRAQESTDKAKITPPHLPIPVPMVRLADDADMEPRYAFFNSDRG